MYIVLAFLMMLAHAAPLTRGTPHRLEPAQVAEESTCDAPEGRAELEAKLAFLKRAEAAFLFSHRSTTEVKERIRAVEERLADLEEEPQEPIEMSNESRIQELEAERRFLKRAEAAFFHSHRSTTEVRQRIRAIDRCLCELHRKGGC